jgi:hypothetical protein
MRKVCGKAHENFIAEKSGFCVIKANNFKDTGRKEYM